MILFLNIAVLTVVTVGTWWLTGLDKTVGGESKQHHYLTRALRCLAVGFCAALFLNTLGMGGLSVNSIPVLLIAPCGIALTLRSSLSELGARGFLRFIDPAFYDHREFDPRQTQRYLDAIARLIHRGQQQEAIRLCEELKVSGQVDHVILEHTLEYLGVPQARPALHPLAEITRLRQQGDFAGAEARLRALLQTHPGDTTAAIQLMRLYAQDMATPSRAHEVLRALEKQPHIPAAQIEFARRSIDEWSRPQPQARPASSPATPASVEELLAQGSLGLAVERLEEQLRANPDDAELQIKLAEVHAAYCKNLPQAEKIIQRLERSPRCSPEQWARAQALLASWRTTVRPYQA